MGKQFKNADVRELMQEKQVFLYELADAVGISEGALHRWLRHELSQEQRARIEAGIDCVVSERGY